MKLYPIRNDADHEKAAREIERMLDRDPEPGSEEDAILDALITLVDAYETQRWPTGDVDPVEVLRVAIDDWGRTQKELADLLGSSARASEILNRKRALTLPMIHKISKAWHIPAELLIEPYALAPAAGKQQTRPARAAGKGAARPAAREPGVGQRRAAAAQRPAAAQPRPRATARKTK